VDLQQEDEEYEEEDGLDLDALKTRTNQSVSFIWNIRMCILFSIILYGLSEFLILIGWKVCIKTV